MADTKSEIKGHRLNNSQRRAARQTQFWRRLLSVGLIVVSALYLSGCGHRAAIPVSPSPRPAATATLPNTPTVMPTATLPPPTPTPLPPTDTPAVPLQLEKETISYSGALTVEDLNTLLLDIRTLPGIKDVRGGMQDLLVTYDPEVVSRQEIIAVIESHGYAVKE